MARKRKQRGVGQRQAQFLLNGGGEHFKDLGKPELPVVELPSWLQEPGPAQRSETAAVGQFGDCEDLADNVTKTTNE